jgi:AraC-like DNA-binding protein
MPAKMNIITPSASLRPYVKAFIIVESDDELVNRVLPDTSVVIAFRYKGSVHYMNGHVKSDLPLSVISGLRRSARLILYTKNSGNILVRFRETGAAAFFRQPINEIFEESLPLNNLVNNSNLSLIEEQIARPKSTGQRISIIEQFLISRLTNHKPDVLINAAIQKICLNNGLIKIKDLTNSLYISQDAFEKRFRRIVGTTPKQYASIVRMRSIINPGHHSGRLTDMAFEAGYFDQPHFNKDFRIFTGQSPRDFFKSPAFW